MAPTKTPKKVTIKADELPSVTQSPETNKDSSKFISPPANRTRSARKKKKSVLEDIDTPAENVNVNDNSKTPKDVNKEEETIISPIAGGTRSARKRKKEQVKPQEKSDDELPSIVTSQQSDKDDKKDFVSPVARRTRNSKRKNNNDDDSTSVVSYDTEDSESVASGTRSARKRREAVQKKSDILIETPAKVLLPSPIKEVIEEEEEVDEKQLDVLPETPTKDIPPSPIKNAESIPKENNKTKHHSITPKKAPQPTPEQKPQPLQLNTIVHRFRNAQYIPRPILRMAGTPYSTHDSCTASYLAISREGGSVELVSVDEKWKCVGIVEGLKDRNVDAMTWICGSSLTEEHNDKTPIKTTRDEGKKYFCSEHQMVEKTILKRQLIGASRDGTIFEIDFMTKRHVGVIGSGGGAVFCLTSLCPCCHSQDKSMACNRLIAAGCEDGSVRIYSVKEKMHGDSEIIQSSLELVSTLPNVGSAVLSIAWTPGPLSKGIVGSTLFAGVGDGTIRKFECIPSNKVSKLSESAPHYSSTGIVLNDQSLEGGLGYVWKSALRMTVENRGRRVATKIWALQALNDGTIVSGDSMGNIQIWDIISGTMIQSFEHNVNKADVLDLAVSFDQSKIMASGVDSKVVCLERVPSSSTSQWVITCQQRPHTHDINSLALVYMSDPSGSVGSLRKEKVRELLCSGGIDTKVCSYYVSNMRKYRPKTAYKYPSAVPIVLSKDSRIISVLRSTKVDFYQLERNSHIPASTFTKSFDESKTHLGSVSISSIYNLVCHAVTDDGKFLAVSDAANVLLFKLDYIDDYQNSKQLITPTLIKVQSKGLSSPCSAMKFFSEPDSDYRLICANMSGIIKVIRIQENIENEDDAFNYNVTIEHTIKDHLHGNLQNRVFPVSDVTVSENNEWFAIGRNTMGEGSIQVFSRINSYHHWWTLPCLEAPHSCLKFSSGKNADPALLVTCNNGSFYVFNLAKKCLSEWSEDLGVPASQYLPREIPLYLDYPTRLAFNPATPNKFLMGGHNWFCSIDISSPVPSHCKPFPKQHVKAKNWVTGGNDDNSNKNFTVCLRYTGIIFMDFLGENELLIVEQPWLGVVSSLPNALERRRYGA
jgi:U3 small nucleolar RNA-associated protein 4